MVCRAATAWPLRRRPAGRGQYDQPKMKRPKNKVKQAIMKPCVAYTRTQLFFRNRVDFWGVRSAKSMPKGIPAPGPFDFPGDNVNLANEGLAEGEHIFVRMGTIVRARRLDLRLLMDAHDLHNRGFVDKVTFMRALAYAFGSQWNEARASAGRTRHLTPRKGACTDCRSRWRLRLLAAWHDYS